MKLEVKSHLNKGKVYYEFVLHDGPEDEETIRGYSSDLITAFTKVIEWHERLKRDFEKAIPEDPEGYDDFR